MSTKKRGNLPFTDYTAFCVSELSANGSRELDHLAATFVNLQSLAEEASLPASRHTSYYPQTISSEEALILRLENLRASDMTRGNHRMVLQIYPCDQHC